MLAIVGLVGCSGDSSGGGASDSATGDTAVGDVQDVGGEIDCSRVGCAPPPPCGEACTAACGWCFDPSCLDAATDADADAEADADHD